MNARSDSAVGNVTVSVTDGRGQTPEELSEMAINRIIHIGRNAHPVLRQQAETYRGQVQAVITQYMKQAVKSDRTTIYNALTEAGHPDLAKMIMRL